MESLCTGRFNNLRREMGYMSEDTRTVILRHKLQTFQHENEHLQERLKFANERADKFRTECKEKERHIQYYQQQNKEFKKQFSKCEEDKDLHHVTLQKLLRKQEKLNQEYSDKIKELQETQSTRCQDYVRLRKAGIDTERILRYEVQDLERRNDKVDEGLQRAEERLQTLQKGVDEAQEMGRRNNKLEEELQKLRKRIYVLERQVHPQGQGIARRNDQFEKELQRAGERMQILERREDGVQRIGCRNNKLEEELQKARERIQVLERQVHEGQEIERRNDKVDGELQRTQERLQVLERRVYAQTQPTDARCPEHLHGHLQWIAGDLFCGRCYDLIRDPGLNGTKKKVRWADNPPDNVGHTFQTRRPVLADLM